MKKTTSILAALFAVVVMYSCSENSEQALPDEQASTYVGLVSGVDAEPYISDEMKSIIAMLDTCTSDSPIPIDKLIPGFENMSISSTGSSVQLQTKSIIITTDDDYILVKGYTAYSTLYTGVSVSISATQAANFKFSAGNYYITCRAITATVATGGYGVYPEILNTDVMGVNPDNTDQRGYHIDTISTNVRYKFTTYIWGIAYTSANDISTWIPAIPSSFDYESEYRNQMQWRYYPI
ncbi:hypothetical protein [Gaoshiqia sp. Z1-71]|uniref:hypothetical protein n=1 Tax=Gaoshiqia hydrogeniformans TaxID=3290090 RepID=UPI003BF7D9F4